MPILTLTLSANAQLKDEKALALDLLNLSAQVLHKRAEVTSVVFQRVALGGAGQAHYGYGVLHFKVDV